VFIGAGLPMEILRLLLKEVIQPSQQCLFAQDVSRKSCAYPDAELYSA
jgi:hypothetical protein